MAGLRLGQHFALDGSDVGCTHCLSGRGSCHVCDGTRRISLRTAYDVIRWSWAAMNCFCDACRRAGPRPVDSPAQAALRILH